MAPKADVIALKWPSCGCVAPSTCCHELAGLRATSNIHRVRNGECLDCGGRFLGPDECRKANTV